MDQTAADTAGDNVQRFCIIGVQVKLSVSPKGEAGSFSLRIFHKNKEFGL